MRRRRAGCIQDENPHIGKWRELFVVDSSHGRPPPHYGDRTTRSWSPPSGVYTAIPGSGWQHADTRRPRRGVTAGAFNATATTGPRLFRGQLAAITRRDRRLGAHERRTLCHSAERRWSGQRHGGNDGASRYVHPTHGGAQRRSLRANVRRHWQIGRCCGTITKGSA